MNTLRGLMCASLLALCPLAHGSLAFSFASPGPGHQLTNVANGGGVGIGLLGYNTNQAISLIVDGTSEAIGTTTFTNARLEMTNLHLGAAQTINGITTAPVSGSFAFYDFTGNTRVNILLATVPNGSFVRIGGTSAILFSSAQGLVYTAGPRLQTILGTAGPMVNPQEAVFTLTDVLVAGGAPLTGANGVFNSFNANASYSGNSALAPAPGSVALLSLAGLIFTKRRRA